MLGGSEYLGTPHLGKDEIELVEAAACKCCPGVGGVCM